MTAKLWQSVNGVWFFGFLMAMIERVGKPLVVILDNASIHTAKKLKPYWDLLEEKGMRFYFLPPYSPELNRIELLWHKMKYEWLPSKHLHRMNLNRPSMKLAQGLAQNTR